MQYVKEWRGEGSRKRAAEESSQESSRKRTRDGMSQDGKRQSMGMKIGTGHAMGTVTNQEYKIRGTSSSSFPRQSASSPPLASEAPPSPSIHPDRRANIINAATTTSSPSPLRNKTDSPQSPLSPGPEHINNARFEEQSGK